MRKGAKIYEVGSGAGTLAAYLNRNGFDCTATEITKERGQKKAAPGQEGLHWHQTDGVHLDHFEQPGSYDYVLSDQVVEHLHPEDILTHFRTARALLKPGGSYFVRTPHRRFGPHDLSRVFKLKRPVFMHLHEFNYLEFASIARECGYSRVLAVTNLGPISRKMGWYKASRAWYFYMNLLDRMEGTVCRSNAARERYRRLARFLLSPSNVWLRLDR
ncbi:MAG: class I SAM-dependent methyltransferase [Acidobacteriaceae bacterium]